MYENSLTHKTKLLTHMLPEVVIRGCRLRAASYQLVVIRVELIVRAAPYELVMDCKSSNVCAGHGYKWDTATKHTDCKSSCVSWS